MSTPTPPPVVNAPDPAVVAVLAGVHAQHEEDGWQAADDLSGSVYACTCGATSSPLAVGPHIDEEDVKRAAEWFAEHVATAQATALDQAQDPAREALARVEALHRRVPLLAAAIDCADDERHEHDTVDGLDVCRDCPPEGWTCQECYSPDDDVIWPCATAAALAPRDADEVPT